MGRIWMLLTVLFGLLCLSGCPVQKSTIRACTEACEAPPQRVTYSECVCAPPPVADPCGLDVVICEGEPGWTPLEER